LGTRQNFKNLGGTNQVDRVIDRYEALPNIFNELRTCQAIPRHMKGTWTAFTDSFVSAPSNSPRPPRQYGQARHEGGEADGDLEKRRNRVMLHQMLSSKGFKFA
jgi:hypothetical protein